MGLPQYKTDKFSYADLLTWPEDERWELIDGIPYDMSPAPRPYHQRVLLNLATLFHKFFKNKNCRVYPAPFDVRLAESDTEDEDVFNVVQPDISIFCKQKKIDNRGANEAPEMVIEILSESTAMKDSGTKLLLYQRFGVKEYWIVDTDKETIDVYLPDKTGKYFLPRSYSKKETIVPHLFPKLRIKLKDVFW